MKEKREKQLRKAKAKFGNRNLMEELEWQRNCFTIGYVNRQEELYNLWIFNECYERLKAAQIPLTEMRKFRNEMQKIVTTTQEGRDILSTCLSMVDDLIKGYEEAADDKETKKRGN